MCNRTAGPCREIYEKWDTCIVCAGTARLNGTNKPCANRSCQGGLVSRKEYACGKPAR